MALVSLRWGLSVAGLTLGSHPLPASISGTEGKCHLVQVFLVGFLFCFELKEGEVWKIKTYAQIKEKDKSD